MKRLLFILTVFLSIVFESCVESSKEKLENQQQQSFAEFLAKYDKLSYDQVNDIQKEEFEKEFEKQLEYYLDTTKIFMNWKGQIDNIKVNEYENSKEIAFDIKYVPEQNHEITFEISYIVNNDSLSTDYIYNKIKTIANTNTVYFDGFISRQIDNSINYHMPSLFDQHIDYPHYNFNVLDINIQPKEKLSPILVKCTNIILQSIKQLPRYEKSDDVLSMESLGINVVPNDNIIQLKRAEFVDILNKNGYQNLYSQLTDKEKNYCGLLLGYVISEWEFNKF